MLPSDCIALKYSNPECCALCGSPIQVKDGDLRVFDHESKIGWFHIAVCQSCGLGQTYPCVTQETAPLLYGSQLTSDFDVIGNNFFDRIKDVIAQSQINVFKRKLGKTPVSIMDYSCGNGRFALAAKSACPDAAVVAVDYPDNTPPSLVGTGVTYLSNESFKNNNDTFDIIILRHVLEHSYNPLALLTTLSSKLHKGGIMYIEVPNRRSGCVSVFGQYWKNHYVPRHVFHFTAETLATLVKQASLEAAMSGTNTPMMSNYLAIRFGLNDRSVLVKILGALLHPIQVAIETLTRSSTSLVCYSKRP